MADQALPFQKTALFGPLFRPCHGLLGLFRTKKGPQLPQKWTKLHARGLKNDLGTSGYLYKHIWRCFEHFWNFRFFSPMQIFHFFGLFWPFWSILVAFWIRNGTILAFFSQGPITFDRLFKKKFRGYQQNLG